MEQKKKVMQIRRKFSWKNEEGKKEKIPIKKRDYQNETKK